MEKIKSKNKSLSSIGKYLPVFVILLAISIMVGSTFAYFTDKTEEESTLTFSKVELSGETTTGINGKLRDVIPGTPLVDGALKFSKSIDSEAIYVRAKISFSLPVEYVNDNDMKQMVDLLRSATDFNIVSEAQNGAVWSAKSGNYFYLVNSTDTTKLMRVDTIDTYVLSNEIVVPRDLKNLPDNAQYMKSVNFHVAFEAIQADNVSDVLSETKEVFNTLFPESESEKSTIKVTFKGFDGVSDLKVEEVEKGYIVSEPVVDIPLDANNEPMYVIDGWYTDKELTNKYEFGNVIEDGVTLYPKALEVSQGLAFTEIKENNVVVAYSVEKGTCEDANVVVPSTYKGKPVIAVTSNGFQNMASLIDIYLPISITNIGSSAFQGCINLALTELPAGVTSIGNSAFDGCTNLALTELPSGLTSINYCAFQKCINLALTSLPAGVTSIGTYAFSICTSLVLTELPGGLTSIGQYAFSKCTSLALTELPDGVTSIGIGAFYGCTNLALTSLPAGVTSIGSSVFKECTSLALTSLPAGVTSIGNRAFEYCTNLALTSLPAGVTSIGTYAFQECINLALTSLPAGVTSIGQYAFQDCTNLALTELPSGLISIGSYAFYKCKNLALTELPAGITSIEEYTFQSCTNLALTSLPAGVTSIGQYAFFVCTNLALTELPSGLISIESSTFSRCTSLALTSLPDGVTSIGSYAFYGCTNLALTELPAGVTSIGNFAFQDCTNLALTELPAGVTSIGEWVFNGCTNLALTELPAGVTSIASSAFNGCTSLALISLPTGLISIGGYAFNGCTNLNYILCETEEVATLVSGKGRADSYIYSLQTTGYESGAFDTEVVISDSVTIYTATIDGINWVRTSDNKYFRCIA